MKLKLKDGMFKNRYLIGTTVTRVILVWRKDYNAYYGTTNRSDYSKDLILWAVILDENYVIFDTQIVYKDEVITTPWNRFYVVGKRMIIEYKRAAVMEKGAWDITGKSSLLRLYGWENKYDFVSVVKGWFHALKRFEGV